MHGAVELPNSRPRVSYPTQCGRARAARMTLPHYVCETPMFMPVGTQGALLQLCTHWELRLVGLLLASPQFTWSYLHPPTTILPHRRLRERPDQPAAGRAGLSGGAGQHLPPREPARWGAEGRLHPKSARMC